MEKDLTHTVGVIKSQSGVKVYSMKTQGNIDFKKNLQEYDSFVNAQDKITGELRTEYRFSKIYNTMGKAEKLAFVFLILKDVITNASNTGGRMDKDVLPILGIMGLYVITSITEDININNSILSRHKLKTLKEAEKRELPQYEQIFSLYKDRD